MLQLLSVLDPTTTEAEEIREILKITDFGPVSVIITPESTVAPSALPKEEL